MKNGDARTATNTGATTKAATPWGAATLLEELRLPQQAGDKRFASLVQLLETGKGNGSSASPMPQTASCGAAR